MLSNQLWSAIYDLYELLIAGCNEEAKYQSYFESHESPFSILGLQQPFSFEKQSEFKLPYDPELGYTPEPDFITLKNQTSTLVIVELKTPFVGKITTSRSDGRRAKLSAKTEEYISQCTEYAQSITGRVESKNYLKNIFGIDSISNVEVFMIYALANNNPKIKAEKLLANRIVPTEIIHYDSLIDRMSDQYLKQTGIPIGSPGITATYHIDFCINQTHTHSIVSEGKSSTGDRLLLEYHNGIISFTIADTKGQSKTLEAKISPGEVSFVRLEFSSDSTSTFMCLSVNNFVQDLRFSTMPMTFTYDNEAFSIGASLDGEYGTCCSLHEYYLINSIMEMKDRLGSFHYFKRKSDSPGKVIFEGSQYMFRDENNNLIQPDSVLAPKYIKGL